VRAIILAVTLGVLFSAAWADVAIARGYGNGARSPYFAPGYRLPHYNRALRRAPLYGGFIAVPYAPDNSFGYPPYAPESFTDEPSQSRPGERCKNPTQKTVTVPSDSGGTRQVTITYCHR